MNIGKRSLCVLALASTGLADVTPAPPKGRPITLEVRSGPVAAVTLQLPADFLQTTTAELGGEGDRGALISNAIAGGLLSLSLTAAGIWLLRRKRSRGAQTAMILSTLVLAGASVTLADLGGPGRRPRPPIPLPASAFPPGTLLKLRDVLGAESLSGKISVEFVSDGQPITLIIPAPRKP